jgi:hypothetical protein
MPAFSFEKISPPTQREPSAPGAAAVRRGVLMRFLDRLASARLQKSEADIRKAQQKKRKRKRK